MSRRRGPGPRRPVAGRTREGQALVEGALVAPLLLVLIFGVLAVNQVAQAKMAVISAAREGARSGVQSAGGSELAAAASRGSTIAAGAGLNNGSFALTAEISGGRDGGYLATTATYRVVFIDWGAFSRVSVEVRGDALERFDQYRDSRSYR